MKDVINKIRENFYEIDFMKLADKEDNEIKFYEYLLEHLNFFMFLKPEEMKKNEQYIIVSFKSEHVNCEHSVLVKKYGKMIENELKR